MGVQSSRLRRLGQGGGIIQGFTPIFRVFGPCLMASGCTNSKELKNAIIDLPLIRALEFK